MLPNYINVGTNRNMPHWYIGIGIIMLQKKAYSNCGFDAQSLRDLCY